MNNDYPHLEKYIHYVWNTGGKVKVEDFDEDWEPIGPMLRVDLLKAKLINVNDGFITVAE